MEIYSGASCETATLVGSMVAEGFEFFSVPDGDTIWYVLTAGGDTAQMDVNTDMF